MSSKKKKKKKKKKKNKKKQLTLKVHGLEKANCRNFKVDLMDFVLNKIIHRHTF